MSLNKCNILALLFSKLIQHTYPFIPTLQTEIQSDYTLLILSYNIYLIQRAKTCTFVFTLIISYRLSMI